ncbi:hypothetical protein TNCV_3979181 [Trichonephila clavipes]|nr:hypothetical protein TNCV_3979181 [Trichonephila clavipes]
MASDRDTELLKLTMFPLNYDFQSLVLRFEDGSMLAEAWDSLERQSLKNAWNKLWPGLEGEKDFNDDHREEITDFVQSIPGFQESDEADAETWMACDAEDCGFQMLNDDEIVTSVQEEFNPVDDETDEDEDNNNKSSKIPLNADAFSALETATEWFPTTAAQENQRICNEKTKVYNGTAKNK